MTKEIEYLIIGAGISGLTAANELLDNGVPKNDILVLEANDYIGGLIKTDQIEGYVTEWGPEGLRGNSDRTQRVFDLIEKDPIPVSEESEIRYIGKGDNLIKVPTGPGSAIFTKLLPFSGKLRILKEPFISKKEEDETIAEFVERRLGKHVVPLVDAFVTGVYGGDPHRLSIRHAFPVLKEIEVEYGNLIPGGMKYSRKKKQDNPKEDEQEKSNEKPPFLMTTEDGMQGIVEGLARKVNVELGQLVTEIKVGQPAKVVTPNEEYIANKLIIATGVNALQKIKLSSGDKTFSPPTVPEANVMVVTLGFELDAFKEEVKGYGFLIPDTENRFIMGTLFSSRLFDFRAPDDKIMLRCFVGGIRHPDRPEMDQKDILDNILSDLDDYLGIKQEPIFTHFQSHSPRGIPQLLLDHDKVLNWRQELESAYDNIKFGGIGWKGISCDILIEESIDIGKKMLG